MNTEYEKILRDTLSPFGDVKRLGQKPDSIPFYWIQEIGDKAFRITSGFGRGIDAYQIEFEIEPPWLALDSIGSLSLDTWAVERIDEPISLLPEIRWLCAIDVKLD